MLARYPEEPTEDQQETLRSFIYLFARLYPWYAHEFFCCDVRGLTGLVVNVPLISNSI